MTTTAQRVLSRYRVYARYVAAAKRPKTQEEIAAEADERLQERIGEVMDAVREAEQLHELLSGDKNDALDDETKKAEQVLEDLRNCETVEKEADFDASWKEARKGAEQLVEELKKAKARLKKDPDLKESFDIADDALSGAKSLLKEIESLEPEEG